jgi:hypothetical protein
MIQLLNSLSMQCFDYFNINKLRVLIIKKPTFAKVGFLLEKY